MTGRLGPIDRLRCCLVEARLLVLTAPAIEMPPELAGLVEFLDLPAARP